jgi:transposase
MLPRGPPAQSAATLQPRPWTPPPAIYEELRQRLQQREDLLRALTQERNRLDALRHRPTVVASVHERSERWIAWCEAEIAVLDREPAALLVQAGEWQAAADRLRSVPGIGPITAGWLLAAGKPVKVARCTAARKLLHLCWAVVTRDAEYDPRYGMQTP